MPLFHLKWCLIMLKEYREGRGTENHLERIEDYFEKFRDLALRNNSKFKANTSVTAAI